LFHKQPQNKKVNDVEYPIDDYLTNH